jgi:hypothetical protein
MLWGKKMFRFGIFKKGISPRGRKYTLYFVAFVFFKRFFLPGFNLKEV